METVKDRIVKALDDLDDKEFVRFKWHLQQPENVAGLRPLKKRALDKATITDVVDLIVRKYDGNEAQIMVNILMKMNKSDLVGRFGNTPTVSPGSTNRADFLRYSSPLSLDPNTVCSHFFLSEDKRKVMGTGQDQHHPDHPERFTAYSNVLSRESLPERCYFEVEVEDNLGGVAVSYKNINRKEKMLSYFGGNDKSWVLYCHDGKHSKFIHNKLTTDVSVSGPVSSTWWNRWFPSTERIRVGVYVDHRAGILCFYNVQGNAMRLLHTERTTFTQPLYVGIQVTLGAEVCTIW